MYCTQEGGGGIHVVYCTQEGGGGIHVVYCTQEGGDSRSVLYTGGKFLRTSNYSISNMKVQPSYECP